MNDINPEAVAIGIGSELAKEFIKDFSSGIANTAWVRYKKVFPSFQRHLGEMYARNKYVKILCRKDTPVDIEEIYVSSEFEIGEKVLSDTDVAQLVSKNKRVVISANGGAGKTFLMRHVWLHFFRNEKKRVPIFVELRKLNSLSSYDLENFIRATAFGIDAVPEEAFRHFCNNGQIVLILDGFDEVVKEKREELEAQIVELSKRYPKTGIIVSGRPDERFGGWQEFHTCRAAPFDFERFQELISKVPFDATTKKNFRRLATEDFFKRHLSFLSNPLLAIMMLMTYRDNAEIPTRLNTFYENCFSTLYSQHDALKEAFRREKYLDRLTFKRLFSIFCLFSYIDDHYSLEADEFQTLLEKAINYLGLDVDFNSVEHDFLESVNLLVKEGTNYSFIHRSFQEYFSAYAATSVISEKISEVLTLFADRQHDATFRLAYEIHPTLVEDLFLIPSYRNLKDQGALVHQGLTANSYVPLDNAGLSVSFTLMGVRIRPNANLAIKKVRKINTFRTATIAWADGFETFYFPALAIMEKNDIANKISEQAFSIFQNIANCPERMALQLPINREFFAEITYNSDRPMLDIEIEGYEKKRPSGTPAFEKKIIHEAKQSGVELSKLLTSANREICRNMENIIKSRDNQRSTLSDFF
ncbi:NACHT domain-containing protein [Ruegeria marisrubri]|uniref:NACHT domain-containing protein n=1 Tax=Ruegeria marisrubri TaxID=1685379 RepID=UPI001CD44D20|nr:NACHT domain-containing protein [Ruegeria marisrubri]MCA0908553.1 NACHT domain-containing protein [Ruegeria marisrubri]